MQSIAKLDANATGIISADVPTTNKMLKMLLPTIFPIAMSAFPLRAATTEVNNSGREVPSATMVSPINLSLIPNILASEVAALTVVSLPQIISTRPMTPIKIIFQIGSSLVSISSACISPFFISTNMYDKYPRKHTHMMIPSNRLIVPPVAPHTNKSNVAANIIGIS